MSDKNNELPGFYRDPKTGGYFRERPEQTVNPSLRKLKKKREEENSHNENFNKRPEISNVLKYLRTQELGQISGLNAELEYLKMKTYNKCLREEISLNDFQAHNMVSVEFIKGTKNSVLGVWNISDDSVFRYVIGERIFFGFPYHANVGFVACNYYVKDMCEGPDDTVVYIYNHPFTGVGTFRLLAQTSTNVHAHFTSQFGSMNKSPLFCCSSAGRGSTYAFGSEGCVKYYNRYSERRYSVPGRVHTLSFTDSPNLLISGVHSGHLYVHDFRLKTLQMELKVSPNCINDSCFLDPSQVVIAGSGNELCKIDLRMRKIVTEYFGHKSSMKKRPFSICNNMLCASGADNIIRIWHLSGGNPINEMKPINRPENEIRGWLYSDCNKTYLSHFEEHFKRAYEIM